MKPKTINRIAIAFGLVYYPIAELGASGSYKRAACVFVVMALMAWFGWIECDYTHKGDRA